MKAKRADRQVASGKSRSSSARGLTVIVVVLVLLIPLGVFLPRMFGAGSAWGEWSADELRETLGFVPEGIEALGNLWTKAPFAGYAVFSGKGLLSTTAGYLLAGLIGILFVVAVSYFLGRVLVSRGEDRKASGAGQEDEKDDVS